MKIGGHNELATWCIAIPGALVLMLIFSIGDCMGLQCSHTFFSCTESMYAHKEKKREKRGKTIVALKKKWNRWIDKEVE